jgi:hypothetical protein
VANNDEAKAAHLAQTEDHIRLGAEHLERQRVIVARLQENEADSQEMKEAAKLLALFEELQTMHVAHRDRLLDAFNKSPEAAR